MNLRPIALAAGVVLVALLGARQIASIAAFGDVAVTPSVPAALHAVAPKLLRPFIGGPFEQMSALAHDGDVAGALAILQTLPESASREDEAGNFAAAAGDRDAAIGHYLKAGDIWKSEGIVAASERIDRRQALAEQKRLVDVVGKDDAQGDLIADAWYELGILQRGVADDGIDSVTNARAALASFKRGLEQAPNREGWLLAAAGQALKIGDDAQAERYFERVTEIAPGRADAYGGLALAAAHQGNCALARTRVDAWRARRATATAIHPPWLDDRYGALVRACLSGKRVAVTVPVAKRPSPEPAVSVSAPRTAAPAVSAAVAPSSAPSVATAMATESPARPTPLATVRPPASAAPSATPSGPRILSVTLSPESVTGNTNITGTVETSSDVVKVVASLGTMGSMPIPMVHAGLFSTTVLVPFLPPFIHGKYGVTFTATDARGRTASGEWPVYVLNQ